MAAFLFAALIVQRISSGNTNYIESTATTSAVCLNFKNASRVGIGYVAGNYKGKASVKLYNASGGLLDTKTLNAYNAYTYPEGSSNAAEITAAEIATANGEDLDAADDTIGAYEGDVDTAAPDATMTFWAFQWMWSSNDMTANPSAYPLSFAAVQQTIGGLSGHYYPTADGACQQPSCYLNTQRIVQFVDAFKNWKNTNGFADRELWLTETSTHVTEATGCLNIPKDSKGNLILSVNEQRDSFKCKKTSKPNTYKHYNVRNYVGKLQEALAAAGVNRWAWYAERWYGGANPCPDGMVMEGLGEETALNAACDRYTENPFGNNFSLAAPYR